MANFSHLCSKGFFIFKKIYDNFSKTVLLIDFYLYINILFCFVFFFFCFFFVVVVFNESALDSYISLFILYQIHL